MAEIGVLNKKHALYLEDLNYILKSSGIENVKGKSFLITGATGMIGMCLIDALMLNNHGGTSNHIYAVGRNKEKAKARLGEYYSDECFHFIEQDVRNPFPSSLNADFVFPLASNTHPLAYSQYPIETIEINVKGAEHALQLAERCGALVVYPSSVEVYGNSRLGENFTENYTGDLNLYNSRSCYPESKRLSEALCQSYIAERNVNVKIVRLSRIIGPTMLESDTKASSQFIKNALNDCGIVLKSKGEQFFSYTYVAEAVSAMLFVMLHGDKGVAYNISNERCNVRLKDFARLCAKQAGKDVIFDLPSEIEAKGYSIASKAILDNHRLKSIGWNPSMDIESAIVRICKILR